MRNTITTFMLLLFLIAASAYAGKGAVIEKAKLQEMFDSIRAKTEWNIDGNMVWSYFFTSLNEKALKVAGEKLSKMGYKVISILQMTKRYFGFVSKR